MSSRHQKATVVATALLMLGLSCTNADKMINSDVPEPGADPPTPTTGLQPSYFETFACDKRLDSGRQSCLALNKTAHLEFTSLGGNNYEAREIGSWQRDYHGTFTGLEFDWSTTNPDGATMTGTWRFNESMNEFSGSGDYVAVDGSYWGTCKMNGLASGPAGDITSLPGVCARKVKP